jgi:hypothetical protein
MDNQTMDKVSAHAPLPDRSIDALRWPQRGVSVPADRYPARAVRSLVVELSLFFEPSAAQRAHALGVRAQKSLQL